MQRFPIRDATRADLAGLTGLEAQVFTSDRLAARSFRRLVASKSAACRIAGSDGALAGYYILLFRRGTGFARLYSIAVAPDFRGRGVAASLMEDAEAVARRRGARALRLEARIDNASAIRLYDRRGY